MTGKAKKCSTVLVLLAFMFLASGCGDKKELNEIGIVMLTGIDLEEDGQIRITVISNEPVVGTTTQLDRSSAWLGSATGETIADAATNLQSLSPRNLIWHHNSIVVAGQEMAKSRFVEVIDYTTRDRQIRYSSYIMITPHTAYQLLQVPPDIDKNLALKLDGLVNNVDKYSYSYISNVKDLAIIASCSTKAGLTGNIGILKTDRNTFSTPREELDHAYWREAELGIAFLDGSAVIKGDRLVGWMDAKETRGYLWITGKANQGMVIAKIDDDTRVSMENRKIKHQMSVVLAEDRQVFVQVRLEAYGSIVEQTANLDMIDKQVTAVLEKALSETIKQEMMDSLAQAKACNADVFGFGSAIHRQYPQAWKELQADWDKVFPEVQVSFDVRTIIERPGMISHHK